MRATVLLALLAVLPFLDAAPANPPNQHPRSLKASSYATLSSTRDIPHASVLAGKRMVRRRVSRTCPTLSSSASLTSVFTSAVPSSTVGSSVGIPSTGLEPSATTSPYTSDTPPLSSETLPGPSSAEWSITQTISQTPSISVPQSTGWPPLSSATSTPSPNGPSTTVIVEPSSTDPWSSEGHSSTETPWSSVIATSSEAPWSTDVPWSTPAPWSSTAPSSTETPWSTQVPWSSTAPSSTWESPSPSPWQTPEPSLEPSPEPSETPPPVSTWSPPPDPTISTSPVPSAPPPFNEDEYECLEWCDEGDDDCVPELVTDGPTSTPTQEPPTTTAAPTSTAGPTPTGPVTVDTEGVGPFSGAGTWFDVGLSACGTYDTNTMPVVAIGWELFDSWPGWGGGNPNRNPVCNKHMRVTYRGKSVVVQVTDRCPGCTRRSLDLSPAAFEQLAPLGLGRLEDGYTHNVQWTWVAGEGRLPELPLNGSLAWPGLD